MAVTNVTTEHNERNIADIISGAKADMEGIVGKAAKGFLGTSGVTGENFAGMDSTQIGAFETLVNETCADIQTTINGFDETASLDEALKGSVATAFSDFLDSVKKLLKAYVEALKVEAKEVKEANERWLAAAQEVSSQIGTDSSNVSSNAGGIVLD